MKTNITKLFLLLVLLLSIFPLNIAAADIGPKPTMEFNFSQSFSGEPVTIVSGQLHECDQADCSDSKPMEEMGPQRFTCEETTCRATAYGFSNYHRLQIEFSDGKTRLSNIFPTASFNSVYEVTVRADDLQVKPAISPTNFPPLTAIILICCCCAGAGILGIAGIVFLLKRRKA